MNENGYGLWVLVIANSLLFIVFAVSFFHPKTKRDWRALGAFSAFIVALFTEMYGYPLTIYLLTGPFAGLIPGVNLSHNSGHLWTDLVGWKGDPHLSPFHLASYVVIAGGFWLIATAWRHLYAAQRAGTLGGVQMTPRGGDQPEAPGDDDIARQVEGRQMRVPLPADQVGPEMAGVMGEVDPGDQARERPGQQVDRQRVAVHLGEEGDDEGR